MFLTTAIPPGPPRPLTSRPRSAALGKWGYLRAPGGDRANPPPSVFNRAILREHFRGRMQRSSGGSRIAASRRFLPEGCRPLDRLEHVGCWRPRI